MTAEAFVAVQMGGSSKELRFTVPGRVASNNRTTRHVGAFAVKSEASRIYQHRVASCARAAVLTTGWRWPAACTVMITHWNGRLDWDNVPKSICDAMQGIVFASDRRRFVRGGGCFVDVDGGDEYVEIIVTPCDPLREVVRRKCSACLESRPGIRQQPFVCGFCAQKRKLKLLSKKGPR